MHTETTTIRAETLAAQFEQLNREIIDTIERCSDEQWRAVCVGENWSVGVTAYHIAWAIEVTAQWVQSVAGGMGMPEITEPEIDEINRQRTEQYASVTREETLELLRKNGAAAAAMVRDLTDVELERSAPIGLIGGTVLNAEQLVGIGLIGHARGHYKSIINTIGG